MKKFWIFQFENALTEQNITGLQAAIKPMLQEWTYHKKAVSGDFQILHNRFVIIDTISDVSGCGIDSMMKEMHKIAGDLKLPLADSSTVFYRSAMGEIKGLHFHEIEKALAAGELNKDTLVFDTTVQHSGNRAGFEAPLQNTWLQRYLPQTVTQ